MKMIISSSAILTFFSAFIALISTSIGSPHINKYHQYQYLPNKKQGKFIQFLVKVYTLKIGCLNVWRLPSLSELTQMIFNMGLTHLGTEASKCYNSNLN